jgi:hypothetical protein
MHFTERGIQCLHTASLQYRYQRHTLEAPVLWPVILKLNVVMNFNAMVSTTLCIINHTDKDYSV